jgi:IclR family acetate operon transcriptional repressor
MARFAPVKSDISDDAERSAVKSLRKALAVLNVVASADRPLTVAEVAIDAGIARPTAYRFVQTLVGSGYLAQDPVDGRLSVGFAVLPLASSLLDRNRMRIEALPHLQSLAQQTGERANLGILYRDRVMGTSNNCRSWQSRTSLG